MTTGVAGLAATRHAQANGPALRPHVPAANLAMLKSNAPVNDRAVPFVTHALKRAAVSWNGESYTTKDGKQIWIYESPITATTLAFGRAGSGSSRGFHTATR